jgi:hypothetical protein
MGLLSRAHQDFKCSLGAADFFARSQNSLPGWLAGLKTVLQYRVSSIGGSQHILLGFILALLGPGEFLRALELFTVHYALCLEVE